MDQKTDKYIYGICDKTGPCETYSKFFSELKDAKDELKKYVNSLKEDLGMLDLIIKEDRVIIPKKNRVEEILILIEKYELK